MQFGATSGCRYTRDDQLAPLFVMFLIAGLAFSRKWRAAIKARLAFKSFGIAVEINRLRSEFWRSKLERHDDVEAYNKIAIIISIVRALIPTAANRSCTRGA